MILSHNNICKYSINLKCNNNSLSDNSIKVFTKELKDLITIKILTMRLHNLRVWWIDRFTWVKILFNMDNKFTKKTPINIWWLTHKFLDLNATNARKQKLIHLLFSYQNLLEILNRFLSLITKIAKNLWLAPSNIVLDRLGNHRMTWFR